MGALLENYYRIGHSSAVNYVAQVSGQCREGRKPGTVSTVGYNHYFLLRSIEDIFGLPYLGDAAMPQVKSFGPGVLS